MLLIGPALAEGQGHPSCILPFEPYQYKIDKKSDREFYDFTRDEFQTYLEELEVYMRCLEAERAIRLEELRSAYKLFKRNFGPDAVFKYETDEQK